MKEGRVFSLKKKLNFLLFLCFLVTSLIFPVNVSKAVWLDLDWDFDGDLKDRIEEYKEEKKENKKVHETGERTKSPLRKNDKEKFYYRLEAGMPDDDKAKFYNIFGKAHDAITISLNETMMAINNLIFSFNKVITSILVGMLELSNNSFFVDQAINKISNHVKNVVGVSGNSFTNKGMFLPLIKIFAILVVLYAFYKLVWKRSFIEGFSELFKFVVVLAASLLFFTNYGTFVTGMNKIGIEVSNIVTGSGLSDHDKRITSFSEKLWERFVDEPYLVLQYGTSDLKKLSVDGLDGRERVRALLTAGKNSPERKAGVDIEINHLKNYYMTYDSVVEKLFLNCVFFFINILVSFPIFLITLALVFTQFWFVIMAMLAPFALLVASFPSQFGVLRRYFFELSLPLIIRVVLTFLLIMILYLDTVFRELADVQFASLFSNSAIGKAFLSAIFYGLMFIGVFLLRKRIMGIFTTGSHMVGEIRQVLSSVTTKPIKTGVKVATTTAGGVVGTAGGGFVGGIQGASIGAAVGKVITGEKDISSATQSVAKTLLKGEAFRRIAKKSNVADNIGGKENSLIPQQKNEKGEVRLTPEQRRKQELEAIKLKEKQEQGQQALNEFMKRHGLTEKEQQKFMEELEKQKVDFAKINSNTLERLYDPERAKKEKDYFAKLARDIKSQELSTQAKIDSIKEKRRERFNDFLARQNLTSQEIKEINHELERKAIDPAMIPRSFYEKADRNIRNRLENGELLDYKTEFVKSITNQVRNQELKEQKARIMNATSQPSLKDLSQPSLKELKVDSKPLSSTPFGTKPIETKTLNTPPLITKPLNTRTTDLQGSSLQGSKIESKPIVDSKETKVGFETKSQLQSQLDALKPKVEQLPNKVELKPNMNDEDKPTKK